MGKICGRWRQERFSFCVYKIIMRCNDMTMKAKDTNNYVVVSPSVYTMLCCATPYFNPLQDMRKRFIEW